MISNKPQSHHMIESYRNQVLMTKMHSHKLRQTTCDYEQLINLKLMTS